MKKDIHPEYFTNAKVVCNCGNVIHAGSTAKEQNVEICSACHPFYTGKQKLVDTAGRVNKFLARQKKAQAVQADKAKKGKPEKEEKAEAKPKKKETAKAAA